MLAQLARRSLEVVSTEVYEAHFQLKALPSSTTPELGNYLSFLDEIKDRVKLLCCLFLQNQQSKDIFYTGFCRALVTLSALLLFSLSH